MRRACFVTVFLRVQVERGLNLGVTQDSLHRLGFDLLAGEIPGMRRFG
jgi:hypothetical protein